MRLFSLSTYLCVCKILYNHYWPFFNIMYHSPSFDLLSIHSRVDSSVTACYCCVTWAKVTFISYRYLSRHLGSKLWRTHTHTHVNITYNMSSSGKRYIITFNLLYLRSRGKRHKFITGHRTGASLIIRVNYSEDISYARELFRFFSSLFATPIT